MTRDRLALPLAALAAGLVLGIALDRGLVLTAQTTPRSAIGAPAAIGDAGRADEAIYDELARRYEQFRAVDRTFELVAKAVAPAVVHIVAIKDSSGDSPRRRRQIEETGSGVIVRPEGARGLFVLTNNHVVAGAKAADIRVKLQDGRLIRPSAFWADGMSDVAVLQLDRDDLPAARLGDSDEAAVGTWVLALGSPFGLTHSVSQGIISARSRHERDLQDDGVENQDFLQTDAAINPGNSGGPLVNLKGEVIGINTAIASNGGGSEGVGFSIPINLAKWAMGQLVASGRVSRGAMGVRLDDLGPAVAEGLGLDRPRGAVIVSVGAGSPAEQGGVLVNDVVLRFNGVDVADLNHLINLVAMSPIGRPAEVVVWREGRELVQRVTVADRDATMTLVGAGTVEPEPGSDADALVGRPKRESAKPKPAPAPGAVAPPAGRRP